MLWSVRCLSRRSLWIRRRWLISLRQEWFGLWSCARRWWCNNGCSNSQIIGFAVWSCRPAPAAAAAAADGVQIRSRGSVDGWKSNLNIVQVILIRISVSSLQGKWKNKSLITFLKIHIIYLQFSKNPFREEMMDMSSNKFLFIIFSYNKRTQHTKTTFTYTFQ